MAAITVDTLKKYLDANLNVLMIGERGVGKSAMVMQTFEKASLNYRYFSASTLDPWVDLVGTPAKVEQDGKKFIELVRPEWVVKDDIEAIFFDEMNRAPDKVLNAMLELIQFKSINGYKFPKLRVVWAAINPETEDHQYSVNHLDPAHLDRFHVHLHLPFDVNEDFFFKKFPSVIARNLIDWWNEMPSEIRKLVSPRRLEYLGDAAIKGMSFEHFVDSKTNISKLRTLLKDAPFLSKVADAAKSVETAEKFLKDANNVMRLQQQVLSREKDCSAFWNKYKTKIPGELFQQVEEKLNPVKRADATASQDSSLWNALASAAALVTDRRAFLERLNSFTLPLTGDAQIVQIIRVQVDPRIVPEVLSTLHELNSFMANGTFSLLKEYLFNRTTNEVSTVFKLIRHYNTLMDHLGGPLLQPTAVKEISDRLVRGGVIPAALAEKMFFLK